MQADLVSVIIPNYNYAIYLRQAIESVLAQTYHSVEVLVVDDGSTDGSQAVVEGFGRAVHWISQSRQGVSVARNRGVAESRGAFVAFLDADDLWQPQKLERQMALMKNPAVALAVCGLEFMDNECRTLGVTTSGSSGDVLREIVLLRWPGSPGLGSTALIRKSIFEEVNGFDPVLSTSADWDLWRRIASRYQCGMVHEPLVRYRLHGNSMHGRVDVFERDMMRAMARVFSDPASAQVHPLRSQAYGNLYLMLAGSYLEEGRWGKTAGYAMRSVFSWPVNMKYLATFPLRRLAGDKRVRIGERSAQIVLPQRPGVVKEPKSLIGAS